MYPVIKFLEVSQRVGPIGCILLLCIFILEIEWARHWWLTPVILATQDAEIRRITF
jgi:hypothetical protein